MIPTTSLIHWQTAIGRRYRPLTHALGAIAERLHMDVSTRIGRHPKIYFRAPYESGAGAMRIKVEINTHERSPAVEPRRIEYQLASPWFTGSASVLTFQPEELVATKLRALFQRSKGRDLFDLWLALTELELDPETILARFAPYRPDGYTAARAIQNLNDKLADPLFRHDLGPLLRSAATGYDIDHAASLVITCLLRRL